MTKQKLTPELAALAKLFDAYQELKRLGWNDIIYCPKDGTWFDAIEVGSTGVHDCQYQGEWPNGHWWVSEAHDLWPSHPSLFKLKPVAVAPAASQEAK